jgi:glucose 1-dehydrogenase
MRALIATPGRPGTVALAQRYGPVKADGQVLVRTLEVGVCGTDRAIAAGFAGEAPSGARQLVLGHEVVGRVERDVAGLRSGDLVTATVRRPCGRCLNCQSLDTDCCLTGDAPERGIYRADGYACDFFTEDAANLIRIPPELGRLGVLAEPASVCERAVRHALAVGRRQRWQPLRAAVTGAGAIGVLTTCLLRLRGVQVWVFSREQQGSVQDEIVTCMGANYTASEDGLLGEQVRDVDADLIVEATGDATVMRDVVGAAGRNGVVCLLGVDSPGSSQQQIEVGTLSRTYVGGSRALFGSVTAARPDWPAAISDLQAATLRFRGALENIVGLTVAPERHAEAFCFTGVKATVAFS